MPNVVWLSPDCSTYSTIGFFHHRKKVTQYPIPVSEYAKYCDENNKILIPFITKLPVLWFIENPSAYLKFMPFMENLPRYTTTYCQYGERIRKLTDIWTNHPKPDFNPPCKRGSPCHDFVGYGSLNGNGLIYRRGIDRAKLPKLFCEYIYKISEEYYKESDKNDVT